MPAVSLPQSLLDEHASTVGPFGLAVLVALARFDREPISYQQIADYTGMSRRQAIAEMKALMSLGLVWKSGASYCVKGVHRSSEPYSPDAPLVNKVHQTQVYQNERPSVGMWKTLEAQYGADVVNAVRPQIEVKAAAGEIKSLPGFAGKVCADEAARQKAEAASKPSPAQIQQANAEQAALADQLKREQDALFSALGV